MEYRGFIVSCLISYLSFCTEWIVAFDLLITWAGNDNNSIGTRITEYNVGGFCGHLILVYLHALRLNVPVNNSSVGTEPPLPVYYQYFQILFKPFWLLYCCYLRPSARYGGSISHDLTANSIWKSFLKYERCPRNVAFLENMSCSVIKPTKSPAPSEDSDRSGLPYCLIRVFTAIITRGAT